MIKTSLELELGEAAPGKDRSPFRKAPNLSIFGGLLEARPTLLMDSCGGTDQPTRVPLHPAGKRDYSPWQKTLENKKLFQIPCSKAPFPPVHRLRLDWWAELSGPRALASFLLSYHGDRTKRSGQNNLQNRSPGAGSGTPASQMTSKAAIS